MTVDVENVFAVRNKIQKPRVLLFLAKLILSVRNKNVLLADTPYNILYRVFYSPGDQGNVLRGNLNRPTIFFTIVLFMFLFGYAYIRN